MATAAMNAMAPSATIMPGHVSVGAGATVLGRQVPSWPGRLQISFGPSHAVLQQTLSTHSIDWH